MRRDRSGGATCICALRVRAVADLNHIVDCWRSPDLSAIDISVLCLLCLSSEVTFLFRPRVLVSRGRAEAMLCCLSDRVRELGSQPESTSQHSHMINILTIWAELIRHELPANLLTLCVYIGRLGVSFLQYA